MGRQRGEGRRKGAGRDRKWWDWREEKGGEKGKGRTSTSCSHFEP